MKRLAIIVALSIASASLAVYANAETIYVTNDGFATEEGYTQTVQVTGTLLHGLTKYSIKANGKTWYLEGIQKLIGTVENLKPGVTISVEGLAKVLSYPPDEVYLHLTKVNFNGTDYVFKIGAPSSPAKRNWPGNQRKPQ